ncbi:MAG: ATP-binding cassette domain-containing protein [Chloroflexi bacterium]|nr:MAG: ATP-binding cassette domain-containing protein [Chloroflexota bacterium]
MAASSDVLVFKRVLREARPCWPFIGGLFLLSLLASPLALLAPLPLKIAVDSVIGARPLPGVVAPFVPDGIAHSPDLLLAFVVGLLLIVVLLSQLQALAVAVLGAFINERLVLAFRSRLFQHVQRISLAYHDTRGTADTTYRIHHDAPAIQNIVTDGVIPFIAAAATFLGMVYVMARIDWPIAVIALGISPGLIIAARLFRPRLRRQSRALKKLDSHALGIVQEILGALRVVKAFGQEEREEQRFVRRSREAMRAKLRLAGLEGTHQLVVGMTAAVGTAAVLLIGISHVLSGVLTLGELLLVMGYLTQLYEPLRTISRKAASLQLHIASAERAFALLDEPLDVEERPRARAVSRASGAVAFHHVSFAYGPGRPVLHDVSFAIEPGTRLGIVGASGAGKTTLISLLTRFYDPTAGHIELDGADLRELRLADLRRQFAVVQQDPVLFSTTIDENIAYARPGADEAEVIAAAQAANAHEFILRLPRGYNTEAGERGIQLSGGQRQRIAIARAFLADSPVLILDEPTSAVDAEAEAAIVDAIERLMRGRTVVLITHRSSLLNSCTSLVTLEDGRVKSEMTSLAPIVVSRRGPSPARTGEGRDGTFCWSFLEEARGARYSTLLGANREHAARWLGMLHTSAADSAAAARLSDAGPNRYREFLRAACEAIPRQFGNPVLTADDVEFLENVLMGVAELDARWSDIEELCAGAPVTLVHGDFNGKNIRLGSVGGGTGCLVFDWEDAGWGVPAVDLAQQAVPASNLSASPDLPTYVSIVRERWPRMSGEDWLRLAYCGSVFRTLAALYWEAPGLATEWASTNIANIRFYQAELANALSRIGWDGYSAPRSVADLIATGGPS